MAITIREILEDKGHDLWALDLTASVYDAIELMDEKGVGALVVLEGQRLVGIISERDYARKVILRGKSSRETPVSDVMTREVITVDPDKTVAECMEMMTDHRIRHLPVLEEGRLVGVISIGDLVSRTIERQEETIGEMQSYTQAFLIIGAAIVVGIILLVIS